MIYPKCKMKMDQVPAIRHNGYVLPCCHFGSWNEEQELKEFWGDLYEQTHITSGTLEEINRSEAFEKLEKSFSDKPLATCIRQCSDPSFLESDKTLANADFTVIRMNRKENS